MSAVHFAAAVEGNHAFNGDRAAAAIDVQGRPVQCIQTEAAADLVVTNEQLIDIPPAIAAAGIHRRDQLFWNADAAPIVMDRNIHSRVEVMLAGDHFRLLLVFVGGRIPLYPRPVFVTGVLGLAEARQLMRSIPASIPSL